MTPDQIIFVILVFLFLFCFCLQLFEYSRTGNPTRSVLENCLASLDNGKHALTFSSGLGVTTVITQLLSAGDHIISCDNIYGGTYRFLTEVLTRQGVTLDTVDISNLDILRNTIKSNTRVRSQLNRYTKCIS